MNQEELKDSEEWHEAIEKVLMPVMTNQQKAEEYAAKEKAAFSAAKEEDDMVSGVAYLIGYQEGLKQNEWISVSDRLPELNAEGFSENVFAIAEGYDKLLVMCYCTMPEGRVWANCYGEIDGHGEWDDEYIVTHWMPLPKPPSQSQAAQAAQKETE